jgi:hypothetical protein
MRESLSHRIAFWVVLVVTLALGAYLIAMKVASC